MSNYTIGNGTIKNIANAIRAQEKSSGTISVADFASRVAALKPTTKKEGDIDNVNTKYYGINASTISALGNAIKAQDGLTGPVSGFAQRILDLYYHWIRPSDWPNYDYVTRDDDTIYFTVDARNAKSVKRYLSFLSDQEILYHQEPLSNNFIADSGTPPYVYGARYTTIDKGYIDEDGYHIISSQSGGSWNNIRSQSVYNEPYDYIVFRIRSNNDTYKKIHTLKLDPSKCDAKVIEVWGKAQYMFKSVLVTPDTIAYDVNTRGYLFPNATYQCILPLPPFGYCGGTSLEYINLNNIDWDAIFIYGDTTNNWQYYPGDAYLPRGYFSHIFENVGNSITSVDLSYFQNKTLLCTRTGFSYCIYGTKVEEIVFPTCTFDLTKLPSASNYDPIFSFYAFANNTELITLDLSHVTINLHSPYQTSKFSNMINGCSKLTTLYLPTIVNGYDYMTWNTAFKNAPLLEEIYGIPDLYASKTAYTCDMTGSSSISRNTMLRIFNNVSNASSSSNKMSISIDTAVDARLSTADKAIWTGKGHSIFVY